MVGEREILGEEEKMPDMRRRVRKLRRMGSKRQGNERRDPGGASEARKFELWDQELETYIKYYYEEVCY